MSKRFGRNQRRRAREALASTTAALEREKAAHEIASGLAKHLGSRLQTATTKLENAGEIAGRLSVLFPPVGQDHPGTLEQAAQFGGHVQVLPIPDWDCIPGPKTDYSMRPLDLDLLLPSIHQNVLDGAVHCYMHFRDKSVAYAISRSALMAQAGRPQFQRDLVLVIANAMAPLLAKTMEKTL